MKNFLVIAQDLRISGTSEGIVSRSFIAGLRKSYPTSIIQIAYLKHSKYDDRLDLLPVDDISIYPIKIKVPLITKLVNKLYWRITHISLNEEYKYNVYKKIISGIECSVYDHVFIRSSGLEYETILGAKDLPILKKAIINFHDPYPVLWDTGSRTATNGLELFRLKRMWQVVAQAKVCISPATLLSEDLEHLYGSATPFKTLPHQFESSVFDFFDNNLVRHKQKKITISYHGAIQFGRNIDILLDAYTLLLTEDTLIKNETEFVLRLRGQQNKRLKAKYKEINNIIILDCLDFSNSANEQQTQADIFIILENCSPHSNILPGKVPFLAFLEKPVLSLSPLRSEMRKIIKDEKYIATCNDADEIKNKLENLIKHTMETSEPVYPFGDYFSDVAFKKKVDEIIQS